MEIYLSTKEQNITKIVKRKCKRIIKEENQKFSLLYFTIKTKTYSTEEEDQKQKNHTYSQT